MTNDACCSLFMNSAGKGEMKECGLAAKPLLEDAVEE